MTAYKHAAEKVLQAAMGPAIQFGSSLRPQREWRCTMSPQTPWRKSSRSQNGQNCVELSNTLNDLRDSKNATGPILRGSVPALLREIKHGRFDR
ncbi:DUF397 domain-containing protein [Actinokineospora sp.]|uniref:DUF397 domain-containing protein n=1 Tax=Actinokineospora sp. TaxID=1872133 RepID=UPI004037C9A3